MPRSRLPYLVALNHLMADSHPMIGMTRRSMMTPVGQGHKRMGVQPDKEP